LSRHSRSIRLLFHHRRTWDVKPLEGAPGWLRLHVGSYRVLYRPMTKEELGTARARHGELSGLEGFLVARIIHRKDLHAAARSL